MVTTSRTAMVAPSIAEKKAHANLKRLVGGEDAASVGIAPGHYYGERQIMYNAINGTPSIQYQEKVGGAFPPSP
jgi:hypothetical protein